MMQNPSSEPRTEPRTEPHTEPLTEQLHALLSRIAAQDSAALRELYDATSGRMYAVAKRVVSNTEHAEDVLQDAYLTIWRSAGDYKQHLSPPLAWMGLIVRSRGLDFLRRRSTEKALSGPEFNEEWVNDLAQDEPSPADLHEASEQAWALHECLRQIEAKQRQVLTLAYFRDLSQSELAAQLKLPLGTIKTWMRRSMDQLRTCMNRYA